MKKRVWLAKRLRLISECLADVARYRDDAHDAEKGRVRWLAKGDVVGQALFIDYLFELRVA